MDVKKHEKVDLENYKGVFRAFGFVIVFVLMLMLFNRTTTEAGAGDLGQSQNREIEDDLIEVTRPDAPPPPPPPPPTQEISDVLDIQDDKTEIADLELDLFDENKETEFVEMDVTTQVVEEVPVAEEIFLIVEKMPEYPGGDVALRKFIAANVKYPEVAMENDIQGKVYVRFVVTSKGAVDQVQIARSVDPLLDEEAIRVVKSLPDWTPGEQRGKKVSVWYTVTINFQLN